MTVGRRSFLGILGMSAAAALLPVAPSASRSRKWKAVAFAAFPIFDPRPIEALAESLFPGEGSELTALWRQRQFEYTWLRTSAGRYADFAQVTDDALTFAATAKKLTITRGARRDLTGAYFEMKAWPDV